MDTQCQRLARLLAEYVQLTEYDGAYRTDPEMATLKNNTNGLAISIVETLLLSSVYREIKDRAGLEAPWCGNDYCLVHGSKKP